MWGKQSLEELQDGMNRLFDQVWHAGVRTGPFDGQDWAPPLEVIDKPDRYVIEAEIAGIGLEDIDVTATDSAITLRGEKTVSGAREEGDPTLVCERRYGSFRRAIRFPEDIASERLTARLNQGLLIIEAPKKEARSEPGRKVDIQDAG